MATLYEVDSAIVARESHCPDTTMSENGERHGLHFLSSYYATPQFLVNVVIRVRRTDDIGVRG